MATSSKPRQYGESVSEGTPYSAWDVDPRLKTLRTLFNFTPPGMALNAARGATNLMGNSGQPKRRTPKGQGHQIFAPGWQRAIRRQGERLLEKARNRMEDQSGPPEYNKSLMDFMDQAMALSEQLYGGQIAGFDNRERALRDQAAEGDTAIAGMYDALVSDIQANAPKIEANYAGAISNVGDHAGAAQKSMQDSAAQSQQQQAALFERLGIADALGSLAQQGNHAQGDLQAAINTSAERAQTTQDQLQQNQASMLDFNTSTANAAGAQGTQARASLQRDLVNALAALADQRSAAMSTQQGRAFDLAQALAQSDFDRHKYNTQMGMDFEDRAFRQALQQAQMAAEGGYDYRYGQGGPASDAAHVMRIEGVPEAQVGAIMELLTDLSIQNPGINQRHWYNRAREELQKAGMYTPAAINAAQAYWLQNQG